MTTSLTLVPSTPLWGPGVGVEDHNGPGRPHRGHRSDPQSQICPEFHRQPVSSTFSSSPGSTPGCYRGTPTGVGSDGKLGSVPSQGPPVE